MTGKDISDLFASYEGLEVAGGCDRCDAFQTLRTDDDGIHRITVHHDSWCPIVKQVSQ